MQLYHANPAQPQQILRQCSSKSISIVSVRSLLVFSLLLCQFDAMTLNFLTNRSKVNRLMSSADSFRHTDEIQSKIHHRLEVSSGEDSQHEANYSNGRHFIKTLSEGMSFLDDAMNSSTNDSNADRGGFQHAGDIHSKMHDRLVSSYAADFLPESHYSDESRYSNKVSKGISLVHEAVNSLAKAHREVSSVDVFHDTGNLHIKTNRGVSSAQDFQHEARHSNISYFISKTPQGMSFLQRGYTHILRLGMHREKQLWGLPMMTWVIMADVFAMIAFVAVYFLVLYCYGKK
eukprot:gnl/MRDRNA2_/MRDRNA2_15906_c0_seq1.p1 gnl/MRDRNA2_/MRDRNA2_15906_c0~~gnl/MRDRNA2_/MRDRNA2_15906_c0_seq1.p1  ORF type:complete len:289 (+),score=29.44 gnl/MRDRNA2_/MRDRNA2_15906_c0_seq1:161-1027(+)